MVPTRNRADLLPRSLGSVLSQTLENIELIVVDDGSTDETETVVSSLADSRIRYLKQEPIGAAAARNRGASRARGEYLTFLDSDDEAMPGWLEQMVRTGCREIAPVVFCGIELRDAGAQSGERIAPIRLGPLFNGWRGHFLAGAFLLSRSLFEDVGGYREELQANQHTELGIRLVDRCEERGWTPAVIDEVLVVSHRHGGLRIRNNPRSVLQATEYMLDRYRERLQRHPADYTDYLAVAGTLATRLGEKRRARRHLVEAIRFNPGGLKGYGRLLRTFLPRKRPDWRG